jgi:small-conductance mechanosensitive channel
MTPFLLAFVTMTSALAQEDLAMEDLVQFIAWNRLWLAAVVVAAGWGLQILVVRFLDDLGERFTEWRLFLKKVSALSRFALWAILLVVVGSMVLVLKAETTFALAGTVGLGLAFAFKDDAASLMAGVILLLEEPFQVGDRIAFGGYYGEVTEIGLRSVRLVTLDDNLVTIPNSRFLSEPVASANAGALDCMVVIDFFIGAAEDFYRAQRIVEEATATSRYVFLDKPVVTLIEDKFLGERFVTVVRVKAYVFDARYEKPFASDVTERVKRAFRTNNIGTPDMQYRDLEIQGRETQPEHKDAPKTSPEPPSA